MEPSTYYNRGKRRSQAALIDRTKEIAAMRVRYGYGRIHVLVRREGWHVNARRIYRLYRQLGLQLRNKVSKRRVKAKLRDDRRPPRAGLSHHAPPPAEQRASSARRQNAPFRRRPRCRPSRHSVRRGGSTYPRRVPLSRPAHSR
jgi:hypothetical protein